MKHNLTDFIKSFVHLNIFDDFDYDSIFEQYLNGDCAYFSDYLNYITSSNGEIFDLYLIKKDIKDKEINRLYHSIFKYKNKYYDINGKFDSVEELSKNLPFFEENMEIFFEKTIFNIDNDLDIIFDEEYKIKKLILKYKRAFNHLKQSSKSFKL